MGDLSWVFAADFETTWTLFVALYFLSSVTPHFRPELTSLTRSVVCSQAGTHQEEAESVRSAQAAAAKTQRELTELQAQLSSLTNQNASYARLLVSADATEWFAL